MGLRFRKSKKVLPGVRLNIGKKSVGVSLGGKAGGMSFNTKRGVTARGSVPGTGVSYSTKLTGGSKMKRSGGGGGIKKPIYKRPWFWVVIVVLVLGLGGLGSQEEKPQEETAVEKTISKPEEPAPQEPVPASEPEPVQTKTNPAYTDPNTREAHFLLNSESMIFHDPGCRTVQNTNNPNIVAYTGTRQSVVDKGYSPCGVCHP